MSGNISNDMLIKICLYVHNNKTLRILSICNKFLYNYIKKQKLISNCIFKYDTTANGGIKELLSYISSGCFGIKCIMDYSWIPNTYLIGMWQSCITVCYTIKFKFISYIDFIDNLISSYINNGIKSISSNNMVIIVKNIKNVDHLLYLHDVCVIYRNNDYLNSHKNIFIITYNRYNTMKKFFKYMTIVRINVPKYTSINIFNIKDEYPYNKIKDEYPCNNIILYKTNKVFNITI